MLTLDVAEAWLAACLSHVEREYPNAPHHLLRSDDDLVPPRDLHPAFHGSLDWHSSVHTHWSLARILRRFPGALGGDEARRVLQAHLGPERLAVETAYLRDHPLFERPYGWAWLLALRTELAGATASELIAAGEALEPLAALVRERLGGWLPRLTFPQRGGAHGNTAFALVLALDHARTQGHDQLDATLVAAARRLYLADRDAPVRYEPSGEDFLSPALTEAHLLGLVLEPDAYAGWLDGFLPGLATVIDPVLRDPVPVPTEPDWRTVHLHGLTLSRAWSWRAIAAALPPRDERRVAALDAADRHLAEGLGHVVTGDYGGDHWLVSFALLAADGSAGAAQGSGRP